MIIVSQDKNKIVNFNNINMILVRATKIISFDNTYTDTSDGDILGNYKTEERAKEVLQEISIAYANITMLSIPKINIHELISAKEMVRNIVYEMPTE